jgi:DNA primase
VLTVDEDREQTRRIHVLQREKRTLAGLTKREAKNSIQATHQNAQRLLRALPVVNPYADGLTFLDDRTRTRRDHEKYLTLIDTLALLHQHQRSIKTAMVNTAEGAKPIEYIEASLEDVEEANAIAHEVLGTSLDELPPHTRGLLKGLHRLVAEQIKVQGVVRSEVRFTRAQVRAHMGLSDTQCRQHLERLVGLEYVLVHRGQRGQSYAYELLHDGPLEEGGAHLAGLIDVAKLRSTTASSRGVLEGFAGSTRPESGPDAGGERMASNLANLGPVRLADELDKKAAKNPFEALENMPVVAYTQALAKSGVIPSLAAIAS